MNQTKSNTEVGSEVVINVSSSEKGKVLLFQSCYTQLIHNETCGDFGL